MGLKDKAVTRRPVVRYDVHDTRVADEDDVAVEEPLEIRLAGETFAVTMRTPGQDRQLALGLLFSEGIIKSRDDVGGAAHCGRLGEAGYGNVLDLSPAPGSAFNFEPGEHQRFGTLRTAACGVCGRQSIEDLIALLPHRTEGEHRTTPSRAMLHQCVSQLRDAQPGFARTGGMHAAALFNAQGALLASAEDVGRHNAVDKAIGTLLLAGADLHSAQFDADPQSIPSVLAVSSRISFEIVQKAAMAGVTTLCGISAPSSLAIDLAHAAGITLAAFVREGRLSIY